MDDRKQRLIKSIIRFLKDEVDEPEMEADRKESVEVAVQCLESAYELDNNDLPQIAEETADLLSIFNINLPPDETPPSDKAAAETFKSKGNELMRDLRYLDAVEQYSKAIELDPKNAVYYCNRAAAYSRLENHENAISDCKQAIILDSTYSKAYGRLGIAYSNLNMYEQAKRAYSKALRLDPTNAMYEINLKLANEKLRTLMDTASDSAVPPEHTPIDIGQFINNPNLLTMASQMLSDPNVRNMMSGIMNLNQGGDPNIDALLQVGQQLAEQMQNSNPAFVENLRRQFTTTTTADQASAPEGTSVEEKKSDQPPEGGEPTS